MTEMAETHNELNQFPVPTVGPCHSIQYILYSSNDMVAQANTRVQKQTENGQTETEMKRKEKITNCRERFILQH